MKSWCGTFRTPLLFLTRTLCFADPHRRSYPTPTLCYYSELIIEVVHGKTAPSHNHSNYEGGNRVNVSEQFHLATISFFFSEWFSVFGVGQAHWTAIILWRWPLLSIFGLHPSSHYTQSKRKPQSTLDDRSSSKRQNCKVKRGRANLSAVTCV